MRIGVDAMGSDRAPAEEVRGALAARELLAADDRVVLFGRREAIEPHLAEAGGDQGHVELVDCPEVIGMDDPPVEALRSKPNSSISRLAQAHRAREVDAIVSAGNTGACVAACQMHLRRLPGVHRPGIAILVPTFYGPVALCDVGANVNCRPQHLVQYGLMAALYAHHVANVARPRIGLLSIGEEDAKGNALVKQTRELLRAQKAFPFVGNVEGRDIFRGVCDVVVCEGFVGNVCLKLMEGLAEGLFKSLGKEIAQAGDPGVVAQVSRLFKDIMSRYDYNEYGGAPLLGINGICIICHGSSNARAIYNAVRVVKEFANQGINQLITAHLASGEGQCLTGMVNG